MSQQFGRCKWMNHRGTTFCDHDRSPPPRPGVQNKQTAGVTEVDLLQLCLSWEQWGRFLLTFASVSCFLYFYTSSYFSAFSGGDPLPRATMFF